MGLADIFCIIGWLAMAFSEGAWLLDLGRLLLGFGICFFSYVVPVYIAEITPKNFRGRFTAIFQIMMSIGVAAMYLIGSIINWRTLAIVGAIPCLLQFIGVFFIPESPRWLAKIGREKEYEAALRHLRGGNADISEEAADIKDYIETVQFSENNVLQLFQRKYAYPITVATGLMVLQQFGGSTAIITYASSIFELAGFSGTVGTITMAIFQVRQW